MPDPVAPKPPTAQEILDAAARVRKAELAVAAAVSAKADVVVKVGEMLAGADKVCVDAASEQSTANEALRALMDRM